MFIERSHLFIPEKQFTLRLKHLLSFPNPVYEYALANGDKTDGMTPEYLLYRKVNIKGKIYYQTPRFTMGSLTELRKLHTVIDATTVSPIEINFKTKAVNRYGKSFKFNDSQMKTLETTEKMLINERGAIIVAATGEGKSSIAVKLITQLKQKTLILVHKKTLADQWAETLLDLTDIKEDEIGFLKQGKFRDGKVVIGSIPSLMRLTIGREINSLFGLKIIDECFVWNTIIHVRLFGITLKMWLALIVLLKKLHFPFFALSYNIKDEIFEYNKIKFAWKRKKQRTYRFLFDNDEKIQCSYHQEFLTKIGWIKACDLTEKNDIIGVGNTTRLIKRVATGDAVLYDLEIEKNNNFIANNRVVHNSHKIGAEQFLKSYTRFNARYSLGLSATPDREDKLEKLYYLHTSEHLVIHKAVRKLDSSYYVVEYTRKKPFKRGRHFTPYRIQLINNIIEDERRNEMLFGFISRAVDSGRKPLFASERITHLELFYDRVKKEYPKLNVLKFYGSVQPSKEEKLSADIVIATIKKIYDGEDIPQLDTLICGTPYGSKTIAIQLKGRIERKYKDKKAPMIIDSLDLGRSFSMFQGLAKKRYALYDELHLKRILKK